MITAAAAAAALTGVGVPAGLVLAGSAPGTSDPITGLLTYGPLGIMVVLFVTGLIVPKSTHDRVTAENTRLRESIDNKVYPAIEQATAAVRESNETIKEVLRLLPSDAPPPPRRRRPPA